MAASSETDLAKGSKAAMEAAKRRAKSNKSTWRRFQYVFWGSAAIVIVIAAIIVLLMSPDKKSHQIDVNDDNLINRINSRSGFSAAPSSQFMSWTLSDVKRSFGRVFWTQAMNYLETCHVPIHDDMQTLPEAFDLREQWPQCFYEPYSSGNCSSSWAIAAATMISNRLCINDPDANTGVRLSPQDLLSCDTVNSGCTGGAIDAVWSYIEKAGIVSEKCFPFRGKSVPAVPCRLKCIAEDPVRVSGHCRLTDDKAAMREIVANGPVISLLVLYDDFLVYKGGVYKPMKTAKRLTDGERYPLTHAVKVVGWGMEGGIPYWLIELNFGQDWGEDGFAKVQRGDSEVLIEVAMVAAYVETPEAVDFELKVSPEEAIRLDDDEVVEEFDDLDEE